QNSNAHAGLATRLSALGDGRPRWRERLVPVAPGLRLLLLIGYFTRGVEFDLNRLLGRRYQQHLVRGRRASVLRKLFRLLERGLRILTGNRTGDSLRQVAGGNFLLNADQRSVAVEGGFHVGALVNEGNLENGLAAFLLRRGAFERGSGEVLRQGGSNR